MFYSFLNKDLLHLCQIYPFFVVLDAIVNFFPELFSWRYNLPTTDYTELRVQLNEFWRIHTLKVTRSQSGSFPSASFWEMVPSLWLRKPPFGFPSLWIRSAWFWTLYKWNPTVFTLWCLASFIQRLWDLSMLFCVSVVMPFYFRMAFHWMSICHKLSSTRGR